MSNLTTRVERLEKKAPDEGEPRNMIVRFVSTKEEIGAEANYISASPSGAGDVYARKLHESEDAFTDRVCEEHRIKTSTSNQDAILLFAYHDLDEDDLEGAKLKEEGEK